MSFFPTAIKTLLAGGTVRRSYLVALGFTTGTMRIWGGAGSIPTLDGNVWSGIGELGSIEGLDSAIGNTAPQISLKLSGVNKAILQAAQGQAAVYYMQPVSIWLQCFDAEWQCLDNPFCRAIGLMDTLEIDRQIGDDKKSWTQTVALTAETVMFGRSRPPGSQYTDRDQQTRYPGDRYLERVADLQYKVLHWPQ